MDIKDKARAARQAALRLAVLDGATKDAALEAIAAVLHSRREEIEAANRRDRERSLREGIATPALKRLRFEAEKIDDAVEGIRSLVGLSDPVGATTLATELSEGLELFRVACPIGVIGVTFESRPDALVQITSLCLKSGNAVLLKGGSEAAHTNRILAELIADASRTAGIPEGWIQRIETRSDVAEMLSLSEYIDLLVPRGSNAFVKHIMNNSSIPVLGHADGVCHLYLHEDCDPAKVVPVVLDAKTQYPAACNAVENILVHAAVASRELPRLKVALDAKGVEIVGCERTRALIEVAPATEEDWETEYVDLKVAIKVIDSLDEAIDFVNAHGSSHTDAILTESDKAASSFMTRVDSACVFQNCSTRFSDGFRFGFGAEVGISTSKIHARGPVGLDGLVIHKYKLIGHGQTVGTFASKDQVFSHRPLEKRCPL